jgi:predicted Zn-dependent peptidase
MMQRIEYPSTGDVLYTGTARCGLRVRVVPKPGFSGYYAVFATDYGGTYRRFRYDGAEYDTPAGVAHYLEHKMFDLPNGDNALTMLSANGADPNAFTSSDVTAYYFHCTQRFEENLRLLIHFVSTPYFTEETVQKEQGIIGQEIRMGEDNPVIAGYYNLLGLLYQKHPIREKVIGTVESIARITAETLYTCHKAFYTPGNMVLCVAGDTDPERVMQIVDELLPAGSAPVPELHMQEEADLLPSATRISVAMPVSAPQFLIGAKIRSAERSPALLRQMLTGTLAMRLLAGPSSPFFNRLYENGLLNRRFDADADFSRGVGTVIISGESKDPEAVYAALLEEIKRVQDEGFDEGLFQRAKKAAIGSALREMEDFDSVCVSLALNEFEGFCFLDGPAVLADISRQECEDFIREWLLPERFAMSLVVPQQAAEEENGQ